MKPMITLTIYLQKNIPTIDVNTMPHTFTPLNTLGFIFNDYDSYKEDRRARREQRRVALEFREELERDITLGNIILHQDT